MGNAYSILGKLKVKERKKGLQMLSKLTICVCVYV